MDLVLLDIVAGDASHCFHGVRLSSYLDFIALHSLLDGGADIADTDVDSSILTA